MSDETKIIWSATPTPFCADGSLDEASIPKVIEQHLKLGVSGLFVAGTCGEGPFMRHDHRPEIAAMMKRAAGDRLHVAAQVSDTSAARVKDNIRRMEDAGVDSVVIAPPWMVMAPTEGFLRRYFEESIEAAKLPVGLYVRNLPDKSAIASSLWQEWAAHPHVRFVKDSSASEAQRDDLVQLKATRPELTLMTGFEFDVVNAAAAGYNGCLLGTGILIGGIIRRALDALAADDRAAADAWQERSNAFLYELFGSDLSCWLGGLKYALKRLGIFADEFMHLHYPLTQADRARVDAALEKERDLI